MFEQAYSPLVRRGMRSLNSSVIRSHLHRLPLQFAKVSEMQLSAKAQHASLKHLCWLIKCRSKRLVLRNHRVRVQAVEQIRLHLPVAAVADSELFCQPQIELIPAGQVFAAG